jgi:hypothetical protein
LRARVVSKGLFVLPSQKFPKASLALRFSKAAATSTDWFRATGVGQYLIVLLEVQSSPRMDKRDRGMEKPSLAAWCKTFDMVARIWESRATIKKAAPRTGEGSWLCVLNFLKEKKWYT